jgi:nucleotide-binding universal stress UspA family protein
MARMRRIVHPTDFSPASAPAFKKALELAKENRASLSIVHVLPTLPMLPDAYIAATAYEEMLAAHRRQADQQMQKVVKRAQTAGVKASGTVVDVGVAAEQIVRFAKRQGADVIVMGTHGHGFLARVLLGSVAERVVSRASCPVLTVRAR